MEYRSQTSIRSQQTSAVEETTEEVINIEEDKFRWKALMQMRAISIVQIVIGIFCILFGITGMELKYLGYGIWIGVYFKLVGIFGLVSVKMNNKCWIIVAMVLNILSASAWCLPLVGLTIAGLATTNSISCADELNCDGKNTSIAWDSLMLLMGLVQIMNGIWSTLLCCGAIFKHCKPVVSGKVIQFNATAVSISQIALQNTVKRPKVKLDSLALSSVTVDSAQYSVEPSQVSNACSSDSTSSIDSTEPQEAESTADGQ